MVKKISYMGTESSSNLVRRIDSYLIGFYRILPFTYLGLLRSAFGKTLKSNIKITLLDLGCGDGSTTWSLNLPHSFEKTGVDIFRPYLDLAEEKGIYKNLIKKDVKNISSKERFDIVIAFHLLEHFKKSVGIKFLKKIESQARKKVIVVLPIGEHPQENYDNNEYQKHRSSWKVSEMEELGYKVKSQGLKFLWGNDNVVHKYKIFSYFFFLMSTFCYPLLVINPQWGTYMICTKNLNNKR